MPHPDWNNRHFIPDAAKSKGERFANRAQAQSAKLKKETAAWKKGDLARFSNDVIGKVVKVHPTSLEIRIGLGKPQKYSPRMVTKVGK